MLFLDWLLFFFHTFEINRIFFYVVKLLKEILEEAHPSQLDPMVLASTNGMLM